MTTLPTDLVQLSRLPWKRPRSVGNKKLSKKARRELMAMRQDLRAVYRWRPKTFGDCLRKDGPCGFVSCRYNLFIEVDPAHGAITMNFPGREIDELEETCALKVACRGPQVLEDVGRFMGRTLERARQHEAEALRLMKRKLAADRDYSPAYRDAVARLNAAGASKW